MQILRANTILILAILFLNGGCKNTPQTTPATTDSTQPAAVITASEEVDADSLIFNTGGLQPARDSAPINLSNGLQFKLTIPSGYKIAVAMEGLQRPRFMAVSPDGKLFCTDMYDRSDNNNGKVYILDKQNDSTKRFELLSIYLENLHNPNQVAFYKDYIYVAETDRIHRYRYAAGDMQPADSGQTIATFPAYGLSYKYGGWHLTRSMAFRNDKLYVSVGSSCNACIEKEEVRATITEMDPDGRNALFFARGLRNSVGMKWLGDELWVTTMGRDLIGPDKPEEQFIRVKKEGFYGWPFWYQYRGKIYEDEQFKDSLKAAWVKVPVAGFAGFKAHSAPLGFEYFKDFEDPYLRNSILVCLHGSTTVSRQRGNSIVRVEEGNKYTEVVSGFLTGKTEEERFGRPCDILMKDNRSFFFTDDKNGVLYYVWR